jgi:MFS family permease
MDRRATVLRRLLADRSVCRVELAFSGFNLAEYGVWVAVLVYAYERAGTTVTAVVAVAQLVPAAIVAPLAARLTDRCGGAVALRRSYWLQASALGATAAFLLAGAPDLLVYAAAIVVASAVTVTRPAQAALLPALVDRPEDLTAVNVLSGWVESVSVLAGPAIAGVLIAVDGPGAAVACFAVCVAGSAALVTPLRTDHRAGTVLAEAGEDTAPGRLGGLAVLRADRGLAAVVAVLGAQYLVIGVLDVLVVVLAVSNLGLGPSGAAYLDAAFGAGGVIGALAALSLIGRRRLATPLIGAAVGWALVLVVLGAWPTVVGSFLLLAGAGSARSVLDTSGRTILLRAAPAAARGRVFGMLEGVAMLGLALGASLVPVLVALGGVGTSMVAIGLLISVIALASVARLRGVDRRGAERTQNLMLLRGSPGFATLSASELEALARTLTRVDVPAGATVVRELV